jgi:DNA-binding response OmpR family regulator
MPYTVTIIDSDRIWREDAAQALQRAGLEVRAYGAAEPALAALRGGGADLIICDLELADMDGFDLLKALRRRHSGPVLVVSSRAEASDAVAGLELGADVYVRKPLHPSELVARATTLLLRNHPRREARNPHDTIAAAGIRLDLASHRAWAGQAEIRLAPKEFELLADLVRSAGRPRRSADLLQEIWGYNADIRTRTLEVHIGRLRAKLALAFGGTQPIARAPGGAYVIALESEAQERRAA